MTHKPRNKKGFTLVEIFVVIAVIALISTAVIASLSHAREQSRNARRIQDVEQLQVALQLYYNRFGHFPDSSACSDSYCNSIDNMSANGHWIHDDIRGNDALEGIISSDPIDPLNSGGTSVDFWSGSPTEPSAGVYYYYSDDTKNQWYTLVFVLENGEDYPIAQNDGVAPCDTDVPINWGEPSEFDNGNIVTLGASCRRSQ